MASVLMMIINNNCTNLVSIAGVRKRPPPDHGNWLKSMSEANRDMIKVLVCWLLHCLYIRNKLHVCDWMCTHRQLEREIETEKMINEAVIQRSTNKTHTYHVRRCTASTLYLDKGDFAYHMKIFSILLFFCYGKIRREHT